MTSTAASPLNFKFKFLDENGNEKGLFVYKKGSFDGTTLVLDDQSIAADQIFQLAVRDKFMSLVAVDGAGEAFQHTIAVYKTTAGELKTQLDISRSDAMARREHAELQASGEAHLQRAEICPHCSATLSLVAMPDTPQTYCTFCEKIYTRDASLGEDALPRKDEGKYQICEECGMYSTPQKFTVFYFYFLVVVYGWSSRTTWRCPGCMRGDAWKMLFGNVFGLIGIPVAMTQLYRCYFSQGGASGKLKGLDTANVMANKGKVEAALGRYETLMENVPVNAGVKFNIGSGLMAKGDFEHAVPMFQMALEDCGNYWPAVQRMAYCFSEQGKEGELNALRKQYRLSDPEGADEEEDYGDVEVQ